MSSRRAAPRPLSGAIAALADRLAPQTLLADVQRVWPTAAGAAVAAPATPPAQRAGVHVVTSEAAVLAQELDRMGPELVTRLNVALGADRVVSLRCQAAPARGWARDGG